LLHQHPERNPFQQPAILIVLMPVQEARQMVTEHRNVAEDYAKIFGEFPGDPTVITISIDSNDTHSVAEFFMGPIVFRAQ
jgi:DUF3047 family protein